MKVGLMLPTGDDDVSGRPPSWQLLRELSESAEESGLDSIWAADHVLFRDGDQVIGIHEAWTILSAVAAVTSRVEIGPLVLATPFRNPALTAKMAAALDEVSGGRLILGLGCGWNGPEFDAFGIGFDHPVGRFEEALAIILPLLRDGRVDFAGRWYQASDAVVRPLSPRAGGPPILIAGKRPRMLRMVAEHAQLWNAAWYGPPETATELTERVTRLRAACAEQGRDPATLTLTAGVYLAFPHLLTDADEQPPERAMRGDAEAVGRMLAGYAELGMEHLIAEVWPHTPEAVAELGRAAAVTRQLTGAPVSG